MQELAASKGRESINHIVKQLTSLQEKITGILEEEVVIFEKQIEAEELREILLYYYRQGGKRLRPALFYAISLAYNSTENIYPAMLVLELMHTMSLYHDDVIDETTERRGAPTVHNKWDRATAIVGGDILHGLIHNHLISAIKDGRIKNQDRAMQFIYDLILQVELPIGNAVLHEMRFAKSEHIPSLEEVLDITKMKTAPLFAFSASAAANLAGQPLIISQQLSEMGEKLGYAFQLLDDVGDFFPSNKGMGNDLRDDRKTPIIALAHQKNPERLQEFRDHRFSLVDADVAEFRITFKEEILQTISWARENIQEAKTIMVSIPENEGKELVELIFHLIGLKIIDYEQQLS